MSALVPQLHALVAQPFVDFAFMRRALVASAAIGIGSAPLGCFLVLRRMSLTGDAIAHALLPGAAVGFMLAGASITAMSLGSFVAALAVALLAGAVTRATRQREDAGLAAFYLIALALGVLLLSMHGTPVDLMHVLFGSILAVDTQALLLIASVASVTLFGLAVIYRPLVVQSADPGFLASVAGKGGTAHSIFLVLLVANLVCGFQALGTLMAVGLMMLPALAARFWVRSVPAMGGLAAAIAIASGGIGLVVSFDADLPSGPCIVLAAGAFYLASMLLGVHEGVLRRGRPA